MTNINLPYGIDDFEQVRTSECYYIDKTGFIEELLSETFSVNLITRPRRFGKTLTMSMLAEFFDIRKDQSGIFEGLSIAKSTELCGKWMNQWPVLFLTLKDVEGNRFEDAYDLLQYTISSLCIEHAYLGDSDRVDLADRECFAKLKAQKGRMSDVRSALFTLTRMMRAHYGKKVILLIDEYDVPLAKASDNGYYKEMLNVVKTFLGMAWKSNPFLQFAVVTGCLRIAKESIFTGANNFISNSISDVHYQDYFGFTEAEVAKLLADAGFSGALSEMKRWYDGYRFGNREIYCPWDVINHVRELRKRADARPGNYWLDTSHNNIIRRFIDLPDMNVTGKFETLLAGGMIQERIHEDLTYDIANSSEDNLWSILYLTGYLTQVLPEQFPEGVEPEAGKTALRIPNEEVRSEFESTVKIWFEEQIVSRDRRDFFKAWWSGDDKKLTQEVSDILFDTISYFNYKEDYYQGFVSGLFSGAGYEVKSDMEYGKGRADIVVRERRHRRAIVIEAKWPGKTASLEAECREALEQIEEKQYVRNLQIEGYQTILCYGAAFLGKECLIRFAGNDVEPFGLETEKRLF